MKKVGKIKLKIVIFTAVKYCCILHGCVCVICNCLLLLCVKIINKLVKLVELPPLGKELSDWFTIGYILDVSFFKFRDFPFWI